MRPRWRAYLHAVAALCALATCACHPADKKSQTPKLRTVYGVFDPALERLADIAAPVAVRIDDRRLKIVQFIGHIQPMWRRMLVDRGVPVRGYMPDDAFVVEADAADARWLASLPMVRAVVDEPRLWRIDPRLVTDTPTGPVVRRDAGPADIAVELTNNGDRNEVAAMIAAMHGTVLRDVVAKPGGRILHARLDAGQIDALAADTDVSAVERFDPVHPTEEYVGGHDVLTPRDTSEGDDVQNHGLRGRDQIVATCDTGVFTNACWFEGDKISDYQNVTGSTEHNHDHGTHTASAIAGDRNDNGTLDAYDGVAPAAALFVQDAGTARAGEVALPPDLEVLFTPAYDAGARVQSNGWVGDADIYGARERSLDAFVAAHRDFLVVTPAGNGGGAPGTVGSPATAKSVIAVGAAGGDAAEAVSDFSAHGPTADNRIKPDLVAPGEGVVSAGGKAVCVAGPLSGTAMATARVAGAAALIRQFYEEGFYPQGTPDPARSMVPSAALIKATLLAGADDVSGQGTGGAFPAMGQGFGRVHAARTLVFGDTARHLYVHDDAEGLEQAETFTIPLEVRDGGALHVALAWSDEPAVAGAGKTLVNDLDLELEGPDGTRYFGNQLNGGESSPSSPGTSAGGDHTNVQEILYFSHPEPGLYHLTVRAYNAPMGPQPYALAVVGSLGKRTGHTD